MMARSLRPEKPAERRLQPGEKWCPYCRRTHSPIGWHSLKRIAVIVAELSSDGVQRGIEQRRCTCGGAVSVAVELGRVRR